MSWNDIFCERDDTGTMLKSKAEIVVNSCCVKFSQKLWFLVTPKIGSLRIYTGVLTIANAGKGDTLVLTYKNAGKGDIPYVS